MEPIAISSDVLRGYIDLMILRALWEGDSYGYAISKRITDLSGNCYTMKETTLYSAFSRLEKLAYLRSYPGSYSGGRERTYYSLTDAGRGYYRQKCIEWDMTQELISKFVREDEGENDVISRLSNKEEEDDGCN